MAMTVDQIIASRKGLYDPQRSLIARQQAALPTQEAADVAGLETAKTNAFNDITAGANAKGMLYSGAPIAEQSRYVGERYLPAVAGVKNSYGDRRSKLEEALLGVNQNEADTAASLYDEGVKNDIAREANASLALAIKPKDAAAPPAIDPVSAARGYAKTAKAQLLAAGNVKPYAREAVMNDLITNFGLDADTARNLVFKEIFPDYWEGGLSGPFNQQSLMGAVGYGGGVPFR